MLVTTSIPERRGLYHMPEDENDNSDNSVIEEADEQPERYTDEWYDSVEARFKDLGDFIKNGKAGHTHGRKPAATTPSAAPTEGEPASSTEQDGTVGTPSVRDTRPPKPSHFWFRRLGE